MSAIESLAGDIVAPLAVWMLISGLDDLFIAAAWIYGTIRRIGARRPPGCENNAAEPRVAIFIPLWREDGVIRQMLAHNLAAIRYSNYAVFAGAYPNDEPTLEALRECEARFGNVHIALCPRAGPTSKADCLNAIWRAMLALEQTAGHRFDLIVVHDAEDLIHADELRTLAAHSAAFDMVQMPVLPLATSPFEFTHGVYCDEFAEYQTKDIPARQVLGGFIPSNGVGTGYARRALEALEAANGGDVFDTRCLTEDYETGYVLAKLGFHQCFVPIAFSGGIPVATREYFPRRARQALRQRTRWVTGIALQCWARHGWRGGWKQVYWWWRDRKGLAGNLVSFFANGVLVYAFAGGVHPASSSLLLVTFGIQTINVALRIYAAGRIYGWVFAAGVPVRLFWANFLNAAATLTAVWRYGSASVRRTALPWAKTEHSYPSPRSLAAHKRRIGEILIEEGLVSSADLEQALARKPSFQRIGEFLIAHGRLNERDLYRGLAAQHNLPLADIDAAAIATKVARVIPRDVARVCGVLPFKAAEGRLHVASAELPSESVEREVRRHTCLDVRFHLMPPGRLARLSRTLLEI